MLMAHGLMVIYIIRYASLYSYYVNVSKEILEEFHGFLVGFGFSLSRKNLFTLKKLHVS